jgi:hypothetical protein
MIPCISSLALWLTLATVHRGPLPASVGRSYEYVHGRWFDGEQFVREDFYTSNGLLTHARPPRVDSIVDLTGMYVVPPYGEAHNHNIDGFKNVGDRINRYLHDGIFYVKNPNSIPRYTRALAGTVNIPTSVDVVVSNGGLTSSGGHPLELVRRNIALGIFTEQDAEGGMYYIIDTPADLKNKWPRILADRPDFIKTYLLYSEEFSRRRDDTSYFGWKGLDPALLAAIVAQAHRDTLRVSAHIETSRDFHNALVAGVDEINHMPGFRADSTISFAAYELSPEDAADAARRGVTVVTTLAGAGTSGSKGYQERFRELQRKNLALLKQFRVRIAIGSDAYRQTSVDEAMYVSSLGVFGNAELLGMWCENTSRTIFPRRRIGRLEEGYEGSFLVLTDDPIQAFANTQKIALRVKQGVLLQPYH